MTNFNIRSLLSRIFPHKNRDKDNTDAGLAQLIEVLSGVNSSKGPDTYDPVVNETEGMVLYLQCLANANKSPITTTILPGSNTPDSIASLLQQWSMENEPGQIPVNQRHPGFVNAKGEYIGDNLC